MRARVDRRSTKESGVCMAENLTISAQDARPDGQPGGGGASYAIEQFRREDRMSLTRRLFLRSGLAAAGGWLAAPGTQAAASPSPEDPYTSMSAGDADLTQRLAIVNADDLG